MAAATLITETRTITRQFAVRCLNHVVGAVVAYDVKSTIIKLFNLTVLDEAHRLLDYFVVYSFLPHPNNQLNG